MLPIPPRFGELLRQRVPIVQWLPTYALGDAACDVIAGITVGLTLMPQAIAYAGLAGLGPQYGLYSGWVGCLVYIVFGSTKQISLGPTALVSLLTFTYTHDLNADMAVFLCFISGCVELLFGILHLGFLVDFVSVPVVSGFTSAAALIIASAQLKSLFGLKYNTEAFLDTWTAFFSHIHETRPGDLILGVICIGTLLSLRTLKDFRVGNPENKEEHKVINGIIWFLSTGRNALVVLMCSIVAFLFQQNEWTPFKLTGKIEAGLPTIGFPPTSTEINGRQLGFTEMITELGAGVVVVPLIALISNIAIAKAFANGKRVDATQEMIALGLCNILGSFARSMPVAGAFSRSAVNNASGVRSPMGGLYTSVLILLALGLLTPFFFFIPRASLAAVIMCAVLFMIDLQIIKPMWTSNRRDLVPALVTFIACLLVGVEKGLVIGVAIDVLILLYFNARPRVSIDKVQGSPIYWVVQPHGSLLFPAVDYVWDKIVTKVKEGEPTTLVLDCSYILHTDFTAAKGVSSMIADVKKQGVQVILLNATDTVVHSLSSTCPNLRVANSHQHVQQILSEDPIKIESGLQLKSINNKT
ncbi:sodium-independent sulfate anion transporter-like [Macrosteles quadrilineatus]|uniref:sodium-independent sulfate anion transporter-like n=1 Tax=Macrosteles quadrilineatus TaxID=74068 RepID=UPI0023E2E39E|nr:sodium-independent sulfate anion transporter-like [Macrosteles quadrilineatus]